MKNFSGKLGIVPALDVDSNEHFEKVVKSTMNVDGVAGYKLGLTTVMAFGLKEAVRRLRAITDKPILYDHQKAGPDMPDMAGKFTAICADAAVDGLILFPVAGPTAVDSFVGSSLKAGITPVVGGEIPVPDYGASGGGYLLDDALDRILARAAAARANHFVLPAHDVLKIRRWSHWISTKVRNPVVFLTGFGAQGGTIESAFEASNSCPQRFAIVGRMITRAANPGAAAKKLFEEMQFYDTPRA